MIDTPVQQECKLSVASFSVPFTSLHDSTGLAESLHSALETARAENVEFLHTLEFRELQRELSSIYNKKMPVSKDNCRIHPLKHPFPSSTLNSSRYPCATWFKFVYRYKATSTWPFGFKQFRVFCR